MRKRVRRERMVGLRIADELDKASSIRSENTSVCK